MKRLTRSEIAKLRKAAVGLDGVYLFSCVAVQKVSSKEMSNRYAKGVGVCRYSPGEMENDIPNVNWQLARSLAVLMFIESNR